MNNELNNLAISALLVIATTLSMSAAATEPAVGNPSGKERNRYQLRNVHADMTETEYRQAYRNNRGQIQNFIEDYSESSLTSLGIPRKGVHFIGAVAGAALAQDATFYVNKSKLVAVEIRDAAEDDRSIFFGLKLDW